MWPARNGDGVRQKPTAWLQCTNETCQWAARQPCEKTSPIHGSLMIPNSIPQSVVIDVIAVIIQRRKSILQIRWPPQFGVLEFSCVSRISYLIWYWGGEWGGGLGAEGEPRGEPIRSRKLIFPHLLFNTYYPRTIIYSFTYVFIHVYLRRKT